MDAPLARASMERNLRLYVAYQTLRHGLFWLPIFFLYFSSTVSLPAVLALEAIYYVSVVLLEVPSGYLSDRTGRVALLRVAMAAWAAAAAVFAATGSFWPFVGAQLLLGVGMAFNSGTDSALLYDSLKELGREDEYADHEARAQSWALGASAVSAIGGGLVAGIDLRLAYVLSAVAGTAACLCTLRMVEPPRHDLPPAPWSQLRRVGRKLSDRTLRWVFLLVVGMTIFNHVPYELAQPWIGYLVGPAGASDYAFTPALSGLMVGVTMGLSSLASRRVVALGERFGRRRTMLGAAALQLGIIIAMAAAIHPLVLLLIALHGVPSAVIRPLAHATAQPRLESSLRATYLSVQSLAGRLSFSASLAVASWCVGGLMMSAESIRALLAGFGIAAAVFLASMVRVRADG